MLCDLMMFILHPASYALIFLLTMTSFKTHDYSWSSHYEQYQCHRLSHHHIGKAQNEQSYCQWSSSRDCKFAGVYFSRWMGRNDPQMILFVSDARRDACFGTSNGKEYPRCALRFHARKHEPNICLTNRCCLPLAQE